LVRIQRRFQHNLGHIAQELDSRTSERRPVTSRVGAFPAVLRMADRGCEFRTPVDNISTDTQHCAGLLPIAAPLVQAVYEPGH